MVIISFPKGSDWYKANWVFRQLKQDIARSFPEDNELNLEMETAGAVGGLALEDTDPRLSQRILAAMKTVAEATIEGRIPGWSDEKPGDKEGQRMYLESIAELLETIKQQEAQPKPSW